MPVIVNEYELSDAEMAQELAARAEEEADLHAAMTTLVLRRLLLEQAQQLGLEQDDEDARIEALLQREVHAPLPDEEDCRRHYQAAPERFRVGALAEVSHILFQVTAGVDLAALRLHAESVLAELLAQPQRFAELAVINSNCPSGAQGGSLGQITRGTCVPEFEKAVFAAQAGAILPRLVESRFGLHIVQLGRKFDGQALPFEAVRENIAQALQRASFDRTVRQYLQLLVGRARISGIDLPGTGTPLVQ
ncbi:peptidylprolyl isomerase [Herbaspirillum rubrisubalbicans]|uniref:peptidylprolyl isomerase n=1 Tax=Herbaspirillum rubrisubalbicans Os34 TaxID=1235827 RepID=A0A6M3ZWP3_9BURK|nr:peptidylprolyl isomerase [Herbaspirillum rubrisubalbicans]QJQ02623.1 peptidylprolyl isomerase [Herbaspirillum rubrisubalbicans Os34]